MTMHILLEKFIIYQNETFLNSEKIYKILFDLLTIKVQQPSFINCYGLDNANPMFLSSYYIKVITNPAFIINFLKEIPLREILSRKISFEAKSRYIETLFENYVEEHIYKENFITEKLVILLLLVLLVIFLRSVICIYNNNIKLISKKTYYILITITILIFLFVSFNFIWYETLLEKYPTIAISTIQKSNLDKNEYFWNYLEYISEKNCVQETFSYYKELLLKDDITVIIQNTKLNDIRNLAQSFSIYIDNAEKMAFKRIKIILVENYEKDLWEIYKETPYHKLFEFLMVLAATYNLQQWLELLLATYKFRQDFNYQIKAIPKLIFDILNRNSMNNTDDTRYSVKVMIVLLQLLNYYYRPKS